MSSLGHIIERKRKKAAQLSIAATAEADAADQSAGKELESVPDTGGRSETPVASPPRDQGDGIVQALSTDSRKRGRSGDAGLKVYHPPWGVLETDQIIVPAPQLSTIVGPDLCRGLILPADRPTFAKANDLEACTEMLALLSMVSFAFSRCYFFHLYSVFNSFPLFVSRGSLGRP